MRKSLCLLYMVVGCTIGGKPGLAQQDWGDAPDPPFPTTSARNGARHTIVTGYRLGALIDAEADGQPGWGADGDDKTGLDDEDGVIFLTPFAAGNVAWMNVVASTNGYLNAWIDYDGDGVWTSAVDQIFKDVPLAPGTNTLQTLVPSYHPEVTNYARFRFSSQMGLSSVGSAPDGEVEDYAIFVQVNLDWGDAPDPPFPTTAANNGARHLIVSNYYLGSRIDSETNGQPTLNADGDDSSGQDEDGVTFLTPLISGTTALIRVVASTNGYLNAWLDCNGDGKWTNASDRIFIDRSLVPGTNDLQALIPGGIPAVPDYFRLRFSSQTGLSSVGWARDGEVEDYKVFILTNRFDWGDAPAPYPTTYIEDGARHILRSGYSLGAAIDSEINGQPTSNADGDDTNGLDDEDGVTFVKPLVAAAACPLDIAVSTGGYLNAWIDFDHNGSWADSGERVFTNLAVTGGVNRLYVSVPASAVQGVTFARFRFGSTNDLSYTGLAPDGEVEDYRISVF